MLSVRSRKGVFWQDFDALLIPKQRRFDIKIVAVVSNMARDRAFFVDKITDMTCL
jgi:hypothetical protein